MPESRSSDSLPPPTALIARAASSPAIAPGIGYSRHCTAPDSRANRRARTVTMAEPAQPLRDRSGALCASCQPAHARGARYLPAISRARARAPEELPDDRGPRRLCLGRIASGTASPRRARAPTEAPLWSRRGGVHRALEASRLLPPQPAEHLHGPPHRADAGRGFLARRRAFSLAENPLTVWTEDRDRSLPCGKTCSQYKNSSII
jgi:hypothetical protein